MTTRRPTDLETDYVSHGQCFRLVSVAELFGASSASLPGRTAIARARQNWQIKIRKFVRRLSMDHFDPSFAFFTAKMLLARSNRTSLAHGPQTFTHLRCYMPNLMSFWVRIAVLQTAIRSKSPPAEPAPLMFCQVLPEPPAILPAIASLAEPPWQSSASLPATLLPPNSSFNTLTKSRCLEQHLHAA
ncbi:hypothetical protein DFH06DRAFT_1399547 [Mycena polygramma]|nr:hypothetical protein DFH06DRAFT_1399547 [Mycena polygramma]